MHRNVQPLFMPEWDDIFREQGRVFDDPHPYMERLVRLFEENGVRRVLDLGCGTGRHTVYMAKLGFEVYALDSSANAVTQTQEWLNEEELAAEMTTHRMETGLPYPEDFFDAVISIQVIHHNMVAQVLDTISEIGRVLKPSGIVFVTVPVLTIGPVPSDKDWRLREVEPRTFVPDRGPEAGLPHHYFAEEELLEAFQEEYDIEEVFIDETRHRCLLGTRRK
ncbi:class I SAM-dependent methyltransferase [Candidatus Thorarchaeota archaeon]|nr:MAG: class I SAM-dependent methyltransferase [Candidatus Thorarchaeota archaeon]